MKLKDILEPQQQLDEVTLKQVAAAGLIGAAGLLPPTLTSHPERMSRPAIVQPVDQQGPMVQQVTNKYNITPQLAKEVVALAYKYEHPDFPTAKDILAIVGVESSFRPEVQSKLKKDPGRGLMQVRAGVWNLDPEELNDIEANIKHGSQILHKYYTKLQNKQAAVQAYNVGITDYRKGIKNPRYLKKYQQEYGQYLASLVEPR